MKRRGLRDKTEQKVLKLLDGGAAWTVERVAARLGKSRPWTARILSAMHATGKLSRESTIRDGALGGGGRLHHYSKAKRELAKEACVQVETTVAGAPYPRVIVHGPDAGAWIGAQLRSVQNIAMLARK